MVPLVLTTAGLVLLITSLGDTIEVPVTQRAIPDARAASPMPSAQAAVREPQAVILRPTRPALLTHLPC